MIAALNAPLTVPPQVAASDSSAEIILFWVFASVGIGAALAMVTRRNIVHAALFLVLNFFAISGLFLGLQSSFLSIVQIIVYAGAIMILFLFVIMLLGVDRDDTFVERDVITRVAAVMAGTVVAATVVFAIIPAFGSDASVCGEFNVVEVVADSDDLPCVGLTDAIAASDNGSVGVVAERMFTRYTFVFELAGVLLTVATIGAMFLGKRHDVDDQDDTAWASDAPLPTMAQAEAVLAATHGIDPEGDPDGESAGEEN